MKLHAVRHASLGRIEYAQPKPHAVRYATGINKVTCLRHAIYEGTRHFLPSNIP